MWWGVPEYLLFVAAIALALHAVSRNYLVSTIGGAAACSVLNLAHEAWLTGWRVNPGWAIPMFVVGLMLALPVSGSVGLPFLAIRYWRGRGAERFAHGAPPRVTPPCPSPARGSRRDG
jgi:hypothetical protein